jgi:hypothetical protein
MSSTEVVASVATGLATSAPANTTGGVNTQVALAQLANHLFLQNNTGVTIYYEFDAPASTASPQLQNNGAVWWDWPVSVVNLYTIANEPINAAAGIIIRARG